MRPYRKRGPDRRRLGPSIDRRQLPSAVALGDARNQSRSERPRRWSVSGDASGGNLANGQEEGRTRTGHPRPESLSRKQYVEANGFF